MSDTALQAARPHVDAWLARCLNRETLFDGADGAMWTYRHDALGCGVLTLEPAEENLFGEAQLALSVALDLPPVRTPQDAYALLSAVDGLGGVAILCEELCGEGDTLSARLCVPAASVGADTLPALYRRLVRAKRYLEEER